MAELNLEKFDPTIGELTVLADTAKLLTLNDPNDEVQIKAVKDKRIQLRDARVRVQKRGKELRQEAIDFQKAVITREKELIDVIEPEEERLKGLEEEAKRLVLIETRRTSLPDRQEKLKAISIEVGDDGILDLDDEQFAVFYNKCVADKNERDTAEIAVREKAVKNAEEKEAREVETKRREEVARKETKEKAARQVVEAEERAARAEKEAAGAKENAEREAKERQERENREEADRLEKEKQERERNVIYQLFLNSHGYNDETKDKFYIENKGNVVRIYMLTGEINLNA